MGDNGDIEEDTIVCITKRLAVIPALSWHLLYVIMLLAVILLLVYKYWSNGPPDCGGQ